VKKIRIPEGEARKELLTRDLLGSKFVGDMEVRRQDIEEKRKKGASCHYRTRWRRRAWGRVDIRV